MDTISNSSAQKSVKESLDSSRRQAWVDIAKGLGIVLVVSGHALGGIIDGPKINDAEMLQLPFLFIYTFHMPLFFIIAGIFIERRVVSSPRKVVDDAFNRTLRAYLIWSFIQFTVIYFLGSSLNHPVTEAYIPRIIGILWRPVSQYWFLYSLIIMQFLALLFVPRFGAFAFLVAAIFLRIIFQIFGLPTIEILGTVINFNTVAIGGFFNFCLWFALGGYLGPKLLKWSASPMTLLFLMLTASVNWIISMALFTQPLFNGSQSGWFQKLPGESISLFAKGYKFIPSALFGSIAVILLSMYIQGPAGRLLQYVGKRSMSIFLLHVLMVAGSRMLIVRLFPQIEAVVLAYVTIGFGVILPLAAFETARKLNLVRVLALL